MEIALFVIWDKDHWSPPVIYKNITAARKDATAFRKVYRDAGLKYPDIAMRYTRRGSIVGWAQSRVDEMLDFGRALKEMLP